MRRFLPLLTAIALLAATVVVAGPAQARIGVSRAREFAPRQLVVKLAGQPTGRVISLPRGAGVLRTAAALRADPRVEYAVPNYIARASGDRAAEAVSDPNDPGTLGVSAEAASEPAGWAAKQWNFLAWRPSPGSGLPSSPGGIDAVGAWQHLSEQGDPGAAGQVVAVLDTGIAYRDLGGTFLRSPDFAAGQFVKGYDFVNRDPLPLDENGHGTHVAGTIAEKTNNGVGLTGLAYRARLMPVRVLDRFGLGRATTIAKGIRFAVSQGADVINMSFNFGCGKPVPAVDEALHYAYQQGVVAVASAGNLGSEGCVSEPATGPRVIAVGGTTEGGCLGDYSLAGTAVDLVAPGGGESIAGCPSVLSRPIYQVTLKPGLTDSFGIPADYIGTSMAAAHVSGVAAMVLGGAPPLPQGTARIRIVKAVTRRLRHTARSIGLPSTEQGAGLIDAGRATERQLKL
jgi:serine protease